MDIEFGFKIKKKSFDLCKSNEDGTTLNFHHTVTTEDGNIKRIRFSQMCLSDCNKNVVAVDHRGNIFVFDLKLSKFWTIPEQILKCSVVKFLPGRSSQVMFGTKNGEIIRIDTNVGIIITEMHPHTQPIIDIDFSTFTTPDSMATKSTLTPVTSTSSPPQLQPPPPIHHQQPQQQQSTTQTITSATSSTTSIILSRKTFLLTVAMGETKLFDLDTLSHCHTIEYPTISLSSIRTCFLPKTDKIFSCYTDDSVHLWTYSYCDQDGSCSLNLIKKISPFTNIDRYMKKKTVENLELGDGDDDDIGGGEYHNVQQFSPPLTLDDDLYSGRIQSVCMSTNGQFVYFHTVDNLLLILDSMSDWEIHKIVKIGSGVPVKRVEFMGRLSQPSGDVKSKYLLLQSVGGSTFIVNGGDFNKKCLVMANKCHKINVNSRNGSLFGVIMRTGEILVKNLQFYVNRVQRYHRSVEYCRETRLDNKEALMDRLYRELKTTLSKPRLIKILKEFGEYPSRYRPIIWRTLLELPQNYNIFMELLKKGEHPSVIDFEIKYPLRDVSLLRNMKKTISCLAFWSKIFGEINYISEYIFPFLKIHPNDLLLTFELIATVLLNQCQLWFEFYPLEPINYLGMVENILSHYDPPLLNFYKKHKITTKIYAMSLMMNGFSEVLDEKQWFQLWDNIISNQPYFLLFTIVAYSIVQRVILMRLESEEMIENFFHDQNPIEFNKFIGKIYELIEECPDGIHPKFYLKDFRPLMTGNYQKFENYPKMLVNTKTNEMETLRYENNILESKMRQLEMMERTLGERLQKTAVQEEQERRMQEVHKQYEDALVNEEERLSYQRKLLLLYQRQIRERESQIFDESRNIAMRKSIQTKESELDNLLKKLERQKLREDTDILIAEENLREREMDILNRKYAMENEMSKKCDEKLENKFKITMQHLENQRGKFLSELSKFKMNDKSKSNGISRGHKTTDALAQMLEKLNRDVIEIANSKADVAVKDKIFKELEVVAKDLRKEMQCLQQK